MGALSFCLALFVLIPALDGQRFFPRLPPPPPRPPAPPIPRPGLPLPSGNGQVPGNSGKPLSGGSVKLPATLRPSEPGKPSGNSGGASRPSSDKNKFDQSNVDDLLDALESSNSDSGADEMGLSSLLVALVMGLIHALGWRNL